MIDIQNTLLILVGILNFLFGLFIYIQNRRNPINSSFAFFTFFASFWLLSIVAFRFFEDNAYSLVWMRFAYVSACGIGASFYFFSLHFPELQKEARVRKIFLFVITFVLFIFLFLPNFLVRDIKFFGDVKGVIIARIPFFLFSIFFISAFYGALASFWKKFHQVTGVLRIQLAYIFWGVFIGGVFGSITNLILVWFDDYRFIWLGPLFSLVMIAAIGYAIMKHHLMNIKVIATELLTAIIVLVLLVEFLLSKSPAEFVLRGVFLAIVSLIGYLLIKSVLNEVRQREQLEVLTKQLESANKELERLDQAKSEFLSIASHQLRTPLTAIKGYSSMLLDGTFGPIGGKIKEGVEKVYASTERMVALVNDLLDTSRLDSGRMVFTFVETDLGEAVKSVCDELMPKGKEKGLAIACAIAPAVPKVFVDQMKIRQVLVNFVDNALKYSDTGSVEVKLECRSSTQSPSTSSGNNANGDELVFSVHDNGWGMTTEEMGFLFKKFSRGRGDTSHIKGTGLGLYVARRLAEAHGGRVWAESPGKGQGSTFLLALKVGWKPDPSGVYQPKEE